jgi:hypothetical protein
LGHRPVYHPPVAVPLHSSFGAHEQEFAWKDCRTRIQAWRREVNAVLLLMIGLVALLAGVAHIMNFWLMQQVTSLRNRISTLEARLGLQEGGKQP